MRWLSRISASVFDRVRNESGAVIVFVAVAMVALLAMTAFVIDFGRIWQERRELQGGATAGVLAVAEDCARGLCDASYNELATAEIYADANAIDGAASVFDIDLDLADQTVRVVTATENTAGGDTMDMLFAGIVGFDTVTVGADAAAAWGTPLGATTIPLIFSECEWERMAAGWPGSNPDPLPYSDDLSGATMVTIDFHDSKSGGTECTVHPGLDLPGGWGWLDTDTGCSTDVTVGGSVGVDPGNSAPNVCDAGDFQDMLGEVVLIAYYDDLQGTGNNANYQVSEYSAFFVTGYRFPKYSGYQPPYLMSMPCGPPNTCLAGYFVRYVTNDGSGSGPFGGEDRGVVVIKIIG